MTEKNHNTLKLISILLLLAVVSSLLVAAFTFAGSAEKPNATVTYTRNKLTWDTAVDSKGVADLNFFGEPEEGKAMPLIHPYSDENFILRILNDVHGKVGYTVYLYTSNPEKIPLNFEVSYTSDMTDAAYIPADLSDKQILAAFSGHIYKRGLKDIKVHWYWNTTSDENDTEFGNKAVEKDLVYDMNARIIIEDNNSYGPWGGGSWGGSSTTKPDTQPDTWMLHRNYVIGYPEGDFRPERNLSRAEVATIFARILHDYDEAAMTKDTTGFSDTPFGEWFVKYIAELENTDIVTGYSDGTFKPDAPITRAEFATVCVRYFENRVDKLKAKDIKYADMDKQHWAVEFIGKCASQNIMAGYPDGTFKPDAMITRAEAVTTINRLLGRSADKSFVDTNLNDMLHFTDLPDNTYWAYYEIYEASNSHLAAFNADLSETWKEVIDNRIFK